MKLRTLVIRYAAFAVIATLANLGAQRVVLAVRDDGWTLMLAIAVGTGVGLVVKYLLDKRWIFLDGSTGARAHGERFSRYTLTGVFTTAIFWGMETVFWMIWQTDLMRELGAVIGLAIGYVVKFQLDKRFVFRPTGPATAMQTGGAEQVR
ncbi:MAG: polysaccharide biosynthesis protein GtrA [Maritimibacter sp.]|nr:polysaccharide biosynthesis protein GtrA [Maritimibacter sp.]